MPNDLSPENQLCFPLYACAKGVVSKYTPFLAEIDLTYTQYIAMMVIWEKGEVNVKTLGSALLLDSGTLTPLLKKLQDKGLIRRERSPDDERNLAITLTDKGRDLKKKAEKIPSKIAKCIEIAPEDARRLHEILHRLMATL